MRRIQGSAVGMIHTLYISDHQTQLADLADLVGLVDLEAVEVVEESCEPESGYLARYLAGLAIARADPVALLSRGSDDLDGLDCPLARLRLPLVLQLPLRDLLQHPHVAQDHAPYRLAQRPAQALVQLHPRLVDARRKVQPRYQPQHSLATPGD